jgi:peptidoglycan/LPS O-acetylase OafA/YrhL
MDGIRAIAILAVIAWHTAAMTGFPPAQLGWLRPLVMTGWAGVDLFFALSGFLITRVLLADEASGRPGVLRRFYARRALRILPAFYVVLALDLLVLGGFPLFDSVRLAGLRSGWDVVALAGFFSNYWFIDGGVGPGVALLVFWSLCVEEHFYAVWPLALRLARTRRVRLALALTGAAAVLAWRWWSAAHELASPLAIHNLTHFRCDAILWGAAGALAFDVLARAVIWRRVALAGTLAATCLLVGRGDLSVMPAPSAFGEGLGLTALALCCALFVVDIAATPGAPLSRLLDVRLARAVGVRSYAMYLLHFQAIDVGRVVFFAVPRAPTPWTFLGAFVLFAALAFAAAALLHVAVERPFMDYGRRRFA